MDDFVADQFAGEALVVTMRLDLEDGGTIDAAVYNDEKILAQLRGRGWTEIRTE